MSWNALAVDVETEFVLWRQEQEKGFQGGHVNRGNVFLGASANRALCFLEGHFVK